MAPAVGTAESKQALVPVRETVAILGASAQLALQRTAILYDGGVVADSIPDDILPADRPEPRQSSAQRADTYLRRLILLGKLHPGERIPQDDVASALGTSRIPVREALITLEGEGWVTVEPHRGSFVNPLHQQAISRPLRPIRHDLWFRCGTRHPQGRTGMDRSTNTFAERIQ